MHYIYIEKGMTNNNNTKESNMLIVHFTIDCTKTFTEMVSRENLVEWAKDKIVLKIISK